MQIELFDQAEGLRGGREVWVQVYSDEVVDWPQVYDAMTEAQKGRFADVARPIGKDGIERPLPASYHPHLPTAKERADHGYALEDWWIFKVVAGAAGKRAILRQNGEL